MNYNLKELIEFIVTTTTVDEFDFYLGKIQSIIGVDSGDHASIWLSGFISGDRFDKRWQDMNTLERKHEILNYIRSEIV